jgi:hypothetical protein
MGKNMLIAVLGFFFFVAQTIPATAVSEATFNFLLVSPSPQAIGMANTYGNLADADPMASRFNPAYSGFFAQKHNFGFSCSEAPWLPSFSSDLKYRALSANLGYSLKILPLSFGLFWHRMYFDFGKQYFTDETSSEPLGRFDCYDKANTLGTSVLLDYYLQAALGFSVKFIDSRYFPVVRIDNFHAFDYGIALKAPLVKILEKNQDKEYFGVPVKPFIEPGIAYSVANIGDEVAYTDVAQKDPIPRTAYLSLNCGLGLRYSKNDFQFNLLALNWATESQASLVVRNAYKIDYRTSIFSVEDDKIIHQNGWQVDFLEFFYLRGGHYEDKDSKMSYDTEGFGINLMQPLRLLLHFTHLKTGISLLDQGINLLDVEYHHSENNGSFFEKTDFNGFVVKLKTIY